jgi:CBS domain-containing protein
MKIQTILSTKGSRVITVQAGQTLKEAIDLLIQHNIGALVVLDEAEKPVGVLSERSILMAAAKDEHFFTRLVREAMRTPVIVASPQDDLQPVMQTMTVRRIRHIPVIDQGRLVGIVSVGDMVKAKLDEYQGAVDTLETQIVGE